MAPGQNIDVSDLPVELRDQPRRATSTDWVATLAQEADQLLASDPGQVADRLMRQFEATLLRRALGAPGGRRIEAAQLLGIGRNTITRKIQELGLEDENGKVQPS
jgi:two-component system nitrogen regulation response regulator GlnG